MNCDIMRGASLSSCSLILGSYLGYAALGHATTVTCDPTASPHGRSTARPPSAGSWFVCTEIEAGQVREVRGGDAAHVEVRSTSG